MSASVSLDLTTSVSLLTRALFLQALRRREFYVLLLFMGLYLAGALVVRVVGVEDAATAAFVLNLGLTLAFFLGHIMTLIISAGTIPDEIETRTIYPVLAKPLPRHHFFLGKWVAAWVTGMFTSVILVVIGWLPAPSVGSLSPACFIQAVVLQFFSLSMIASLGLLLSLCIPKSVNIVLVLLLYTAGHRIITAIRGRLGETLIASLWDWLLRYIPDFGVLNLIDRYTDGYPPLGVGDFLLRVLYATIVTFTCVTVGNYLFYRRAL